MRKVYGSLMVRSSSTPSLQPYNIPKYFRILVPREGRVLMFENRVLRRIFGPKREEVTGGWKSFT
jgi:hypothetical protein